MFPLELDATLESKRFIDLKANKEVKKNEENYLRKEINVITTNTIVRCL